MNRVVGWWFVGGGMHRAHGYSFALLFRARRRALSKSLRGLYTEVEMESMLAGTHLEGNMTVDDAYDAAAGTFLAQSSVLKIMGTAIVASVRRDPCRLLPMWEASPARFVLEYARWSGSGPGFRATAGNDSAAPSFYSIYSANTDARIFPDPLKFDPSRDLSQTLTWNALEEDYQASTTGGASGHGGATTMRRACPGRGFSVRALTALVGPLLAPLRSASSCNEDLRVFHGVKFHAEIVPVLNGTASLEVLNPES